MELGETCEQGALRETLEEAGAQVKLRQLLAVLSLPHTSQVHLFYSADLIDGIFEAGIESLEVALFSYAEIPWSELAFSTVTHTLKHYFSHPNTANMPQLVATISTMNTD
jgi:ADP-ribose pyrophosphatase YjhB (NUDIX family)